MADTQPLAPTDAELLSLNEGEVYFSESPSKYPEVHGTQYHAGAPGVLAFARAALAKWGAQPVPASAAEFALRALVAAGHVTQERVDQALALPGAPAQPVVPEGYALVPVKSVTEGMHIAAVKVLQRASGIDGLPQRMLAAMLAAAPQPVEREPLTDESARKLALTASEWCRSEGISVEDAVEVVRATERAHGITKGAQHDPD